MLEPSSVRCLLVIASVLATGCPTAADPEALDRVDVRLTLAEMPGLALRFENITQPGQIPALRATLDYRVADLIDVDRRVAGCAQLDRTFEVWFDERAQARPIAGGWDHDAGLCIPPALFVSAYARRSGIPLVISDRSRTISPDLGDVFVIRRADPIGAPDWRFHPGQHVDVAWSPPGDLAYEHVAASLLERGVTKYIVTPETFTRGTNTVGFTLPGLGASGTLMISFWGERRIECGDLTCTLHDVQHVSHDAVIAPPPQ